MVAFSVQRRGLQKRILQRSLVLYFPNGGQWDLILVYSLASVRSDFAKIGGGACVPVSSRLCCGGVPGGQAGSVLGVSDLPMGSLAWFLVLHGVVPLAPCGVSVVLCCVVSHCYPGDSVLWCPSGSARLWEHAPLLLGFAAGLIISNSHPDGTARALLKP